MNTTGEGTTLYHRCYSQNLHVKSVYLANEICMATVKKARARIGRCCLRLVFLLACLTTTATGVVDVTIVSKYQFFDESADTWLYCYYTGDLQNQKRYQFGVEVDTGSGTGFTSRRSTGKVTGRWNVRIWDGSGDFRVGAFSCRVRTSDGSQTEKAITFKMKSQADVWPVAFTVTANTGDPVTLQMVQKSNRTGTLVWRKGGVGGTVLAGQNGLNLIIASVQSSDEGIYECYYQGDTDRKQGIMRLIVRGCAESKWGSSCIGDCPVCYNGGVCDDNTGECVCAPGFNGQNCENACANNRIGTSCTRECEGGDCTGQLLCVMDPYGCSCAPGLMGIECNLVCPDGMFGAGCTQTCHCASGGSVCDVRTGVCSSGGCEAGWKGTNCQEATVSYEDLFTREEGHFFGDRPDHITAYISIDADECARRCLQGYGSYDGVNPPCLSFNHRPAGSAEGGSARCWLKSSDKDTAASPGPEWDSWPHRNYYQRKHILAPQDCTDMFALGIQYSHVFTIGHPQPFQAYCDMDTDGGGWTVIQRRQDGSVPFDKLWTEYEQGFGNPIGEYWLGLENINSLTTQKQNELYVYLEDWEMNSRFAQYSTFSVGDATSKYTATIDGYSGDAGNSLDPSTTRHSINNRQFSTTDQDNAGSSTNCAATFGQGGWWYTPSCGWALLNGQFLTGCSVPAPGTCSTADGIVWQSWRGYRYSLKKTVMMIRPSNFSVSSFRPCQNGETLTSGPEDSGLYICVCAEGWYGAFCNQECGHCYGNQTCDRIDGTCPTGGTHVCEAGYHGDNCHQVDGATCEAWGDPHYTTFDRRVHHFQGPCDYVLAEHCGNTTDFRVEVTNEPCGSSSRVSCTRAVYMDVKGYRISIIQGKEVLVDGVRYTPPFNLNDTVWGSYSGMFVLLKTDTSVKVFYDGSHYAKVFVPGTYRNQMCGLCGDFDGNQANDFMTSYGWVTGHLNTFGESWVTSWSSCTGGATDDGLSTSAPPGVCDPVLQQTVAGPAMCGILTEPNGTFSVCENVIDLGVFYDSCVFDVCANSGDAAQLCQNLESAAHACTWAGFLGLSWRRHDLCPLSCGPNSTYSACTSACPNTCSSSNEEANCVDICVEGCECNPGLVLSGDSCVHPDECGCQRNGRYFEVDDVWGEPGNLQCTCQRRGTISCTSIPCEDEFIWAVHDYDYRCYCPHQHQCTAPEEPSDLTLVTTSETTIAVSWSTSLFTDGYRVNAIALDGHLAGRSYGTYALTNNTVRISGLEPGTMYSFNVYSYRGSKVSNDAVTGQFATVVDAPTGLHVVQVTFNTISISWTLPRSTLLRFRVTDAPIGGSSRDLYPPPGPQDTSATVTGLLPGVQYRITLVAIGLHGESDGVTIIASTETGRGSLTCDTSYMRVVFMREVLVGVDVDTVRLRDSSCRADVNSTHVTLTAPLNGCGTTAQDGTDTSKISFTNEVVSGAPVTDVVIIRNLELRWPFRCDYVRQDIVGVGPILFPIPLPNVTIPRGNGSFTFSMNLYHSEAFLRPFEQNEFPVKVTVNHMLHFGVAVASEVSGVVLFVENCKATPTSNHDDAKQYFIIRDGCEEDDTLEEFETSDPISRRYAIRAFRFINETMVYIHCDVMVCLADNPDSRCLRGCEAPPARRRREVSAGMHRRAAVVQGPIVLVPEENTPAPPVCPTDCHEHAVCSAATKACVCEEGWVGNGVHCEEKDFDWCSIISCDISNNHRCRNTAGSYVCECRPGFVEFNGRCEVSQVYQFSIRLQARTFSKDLEDKKSQAFIALVAEVTQAIEELFLRTDMSGMFLGVVILGFRSGSVVVDMRLNVRESAQVGQAQMAATFRDAVLSQNGTHLAIDKDSVELADFDECSSPDDHDCSTEAICVNTAGSFTCQCQPGYMDQSAARAESPGRVCISSGDEFPVMWVAVGGGVFAACIVVVMATCLCFRKRRQQGRKSKRRDDMEDHTAYDNLAYSTAAEVHGNSVPVVGAPIPLRPLSYA